MTQSTHQVPSWRAFWSRDLSRHAARAFEGGDASPLWRGRLGWDTAVLAVVIASALTADAVLLASPANLRGVPVGLLALFLWAPALAAGLAAMLALRAYAIRRTPTEPEADFLAACAPAQERTALALRRALGRVYGVRPDKIRSDATGLSLSILMERPTLGEFTAALLNERGSRLTAPALAARLGRIPSREPVALLAARIERALARDVA